MNDIAQRFSAQEGWLLGLEIIAVAFIVLAAGELVWDLVRRNKRSLAETGANTVVLIGNQLLELTAFGTIFSVGLLASESFALFEIPIDAWSWAAAILFADLMYYWTHRIEHRVRLFWSYHSVHHSSPDYDLTTAFRLAWFEGAVEWLFFVPMVLAGFDAVQVVIALLVVLYYQNWIHTQKIGRLGWLDGILNTPSAHRVHHGRNALYLDRNFGGILIIWDRLFGTYQREAEEVDFGITEPVRSSNPVIVNFHEIGMILRDCWRARSLSDILGYLFRPPGWKPATKARNDGGAHA